MQRYGMRRVDDWVPSSIVAAFLLGRLWLSWLHSRFDNLTTNVMYILPSSWDFMVPMIQSQGVEALHWLNN